MEIDYRLKYLKYKTKYLELKQKIGGSNVNKFSTGFTKGAFNKASEAFKNVTQNVTKNVTEHVTENLIQKVKSEGPKLIDKALKKVSTVFERNLSSNVKELNNLIGEIYTLLSNQNINDIQNVYIKFIKLIFNINQNINIIDAINKGDNLKNEYKNIIYSEKFVRENTFIVNNFNEDIKKELKTTFDINNINKTLINHIMDVNRSVLDKLWYLKK